jgi:hypothetical protein
MRTWLVTLTVGCFLSVISGVAQIAATTAPASPEEQALVSKTHALAQALKTKDLGFLNRTLTADFHEVWSDGRLHSKADVLGEMEEWRSVQEFSPYNLRVLPVNNDAALVTYDCIVKMPEGDAPNMAPRYQHISDLWLKQDDQWRLRFEQFTPVRPID